MGIETRTSGSLGQCLTNWARQESVGQEISEMSFVCFMHHFTCWTLFISRAWSIEHDFIKAMKWFRLATECWLSSVGKALAWRSGGPGFQPHWGQFLTKFILPSFCVTLNLSDNLTETPIVKNSTVAGFSAQIRLHPVWKEIHGKGKPQAAHAVAYWKIQLLLWYLW